MIDELMSPAELADMRKVVPGTLANERSNGTGPRYVKLRGRVFYRKKDVQAWIEANIRQSTCEAA